MSNEGSVHVTVDTSAVAAEISRLKSDINHVANEVRGVSSNINILQAELLTQMGITIERLTAVKNEVSRSIEAAAQSTIVETASDIFGKIGIITSSARRIGQQYHKSIIRCGRTSDKFDHLNNEVKTSYHTDMQRLGKYILDVWQNHYQKVENLIQKHHSGFLTVIKTSVEQIRKYREQTLEKLLNSVKEKLSYFLEQRKNFHDSISMINAKSLDVPIDKIAIPVILVNEQETSATQVKIGHEVIRENNEHVCFSLKETDTFKTYRADGSTLNQVIQWRNITSVESNRLELNLGQLLTMKYIGSEYHELLVRNLRKYPPKVPVQGESSN
ncbi:MAG TPA: hypothetical protein VK469_09825 [Candidatus Kapabacteria bacterium]|nr:hypothetical protein [Candidatus Kapabacteria bacterium]